MKHIIARPHSTQTLLLCAMCILAFIRRMPCMVMPLLNFSSNCNYQTQEEWRKAKIVLTFGIVTVTDFEKWFMHNIISHMYGIKTFDNVGHFYYIISLSLSLSRFDLNCVELYACERAPVCLSLCEYNEKPVRICTNESNEKIANVTR